MAAHLAKVVTMKPADLIGSGVEAGPRRQLPPDWVEGTDKAVEPVFRGDFSVARDNLLALLTANPDNYYIQANLAVACELAGDDAGALQWVEKAISAKPGAHEGTEWMHAAVLRAKLALVRDPAWLETHRISGIPSGEFGEDFTLADGPSILLGLADIRAALAAHAVPRLLFVKPQDKIAAALLFELARVEARLSSVEAGLGMLALSETYGKTGIGSWRERWLAVKPGPLRSWFLNRGGDNVMHVTFFSGGLILLTAVMLILRRRQLKKKRAASAAKLEALSATNSGTTNPL